MKRRLLRLLWLGACLLALILLAVMVLQDRGEIRQLTPQSAAARWGSEEKPYAMASVFLQEKDALRGDRMGEIFLKLEGDLTAAGVPGKDYPWYYAASCRRDATVYADGASCALELTAVRGDFFQAHPMVLLSGWYMQESDPMHDRIVLNREAAWDLFYSDNVTGQFVELEGVRYQVAAVVEEEAGKQTQTAAGDTRRAWVFGDSPVFEEEPGYTCFEAVLPQPVRDFAAATLRTALTGMIPEKTEITDNTGRFSLGSRWKVFRTLGTRGISSEAISYPYWENAARLTENHLARRLIPEGLLLALPLCSLLGILWTLNRKRTWGLHSIPELISDRIDRRRARRYYASQSKNTHDKKR